MSADSMLLFTPINLPSGVKVPNRLALAPMTTYSGNDDGTITQAELDYLTRRVSGLGMVITAACHVHPSGRAFDGQWGCDAPDKKDSLAAVAAVIHAGGARAILQLHHGGRMCPSRLLGHAPLSASAVPAVRAGAETPTAMTKAQIEETIAAFGAATWRAIDAGYDGVEIHGANTYLLQQFFSPHSNHRSDIWGGSTEQRMRFPVAVVTAVLRAAKAAGRPFAVGYRISPEEAERPGITIKDTMKLVDRLCDERLDWLHISLKDFRSHSIRSTSDKTTPLAHIIDTIQRRLPIIGCGSIHGAADAYELLGGGCNIAALGRIMLTEPDWVRKISAPDGGPIRTALPAQGAADTLTLPEPMVRRLLATKGWIPVTHM